MLTEDRSSLARFPIPDSRMSRKRRYSRLSFWGTVLCHTQTAGDHNEKKRNTLPDVNFRSFQEFVSDPTDSHRQSFLLGYHDVLPMWLRQTRTRTRARRDPIQTYPTQQSSSTSNQACFNAAAPRSLWLHGPQARTNGARFLAAREH